MGGEGLEKDINKVEMIPEFQIVDYIFGSYSYEEAKEIINNRDDGARLPTSKEVQILKADQIPAGCWIESGDSPKEESYMDVPDFGLSYQRTEYSGRIKKPILLVK